MNYFAPKKITNLILDIDNVVCDCRAWFKHIPQENTREGWDNYNKYHYLARINKSFAYFIWNLKGIGLKSIDFVTSREDCYGMREITWNHINKFLYLVCLDKELDLKLYMRNYMDYRPASEVKRDIALTHIIPYKFVDLAIDDSQANVDMFNSLGIKAVRYDKFD